jgi:hypothetical protein
MQSRKVRSVRMTVWNIHFLNARNTLTLLLPQIRATAREAVARVSEHADLPRFDLVVKAQPGGGIPDWGVGGYAPAPGLIEVTLNPDRFDAALLLRTLVHEMHHLIRWDGPGYGRSLGEALVSEGLAGHFVLQVLGGKPDPWDAVTPAAGVARQAMNEWARLDHDHARWFLGKGDLRKWTGYGLGHRLIAEHLAQAQGDDAVTLSTTRADAFRPAMRRLVGTDGQSPEDEMAKDEVAEDEMADQDATTGDKPGDGAATPASELGDTDAAAADTVPTDRPSDSGAEDRSAQDDETVSTGKPAPGDDDPKASADDKKG